MREELLSILVEPVTEAKLQLRDAVRRDGRIESGVLRSEKSGREFRIERGIPRFVEMESYADSFGEQWNKFRLSQLDSATGGTHSRRRFETETGWKPSDLEGKLVLDAGCGAGRFAEIAASMGAHLVALDLSSAVDAAAQTLARFPHASVVQASMFEPPFRRGTFDFGYTIGVVQHTPDRRRAIMTVVDMVKPGGQVALTMYTRKPWTKLNAKYVARVVTKHLPREMLLGAIKTTMPVLFPITDVLFGAPMVDKLARFVIPIANYPERTEFTREQRYEEAVLDTFDMLSPAYDEPVSVAELTEALRAAGVREWRLTAPGRAQCIAVR